MVCTTFGAVAALVSRGPGSGDALRAIGPGVDHVAVLDSDWTAGISGRGHPGAVGSRIGRRFQHQAAGTHQQRRSGVKHREGLERIGAVAAGIGSGPETRDHFSPAAAIADAVGVSNGQAAAGIQGGGDSVSVGADIAVWPLQHGIGWRADRRRSGVTHRDGLKGIRGVVTVRRGPGAPDGLGAGATVADHIAITHGNGPAAGIRRGGHAGGVGRYIRCRAFQYHIGRRTEQGRSGISHREALDTGTAVAAIVGGRPGAVQHRHGDARRHRRLRRQRGRRRLRLRRR